MVWHGLETWLWPDLIIRDYGEMAMNMGLLATVDKRLAHRINQYFDQKSIV
jgi:hypothetical protein